MALSVTDEGEQIPVNVVGSSTFGRYPKISLEKTYNMFISDEWLVDFPAYEKVIQLVANGRQGRGIFRSFRGNLLVAVVDTSVYKIDTALGAVLIGSLSTSVGEVFMDENLNNQIAIVDGLHIYIYNYSLGASLTVQHDTTLDTGALVPNYVTYHDEYFLIGNANTTNVGAFWYVYEPDPILDTNIVLFSVQRLQTKPDHALAIKRIPGQSSNVLVFGGSVCEVQNQTGGTDPVTGDVIAYARNNSLNIDYGCVSISTIADSDTHIAWLGINQSNAPVIMVMTGQKAESISTDGIDHVLDDIIFPAQSTAMMYRVDGHLFYHITFFNPADNLSLVYDFNTEKFYHISDWELNFHPARQTVYFNNNLYFISFNGGNIYRLSTDLTFINEDIPDPTGVFPPDTNLQYEMQRIRICKPIRLPTSMPFKANQFIITIEQGDDNLPPVHNCVIWLITEDNIRMFSQTNIQLVPEGAGNEDCPGMPYRGRIDLALSKDGDQTFGNYVARQLNPLGVRKNILRWNKMGVANDLALKLRFWSLGRFVVGAAFIEITP
jgi:hypothetical protein